METTEYMDEKGRKYRAYQSGDMRVMAGPPEGLVDDLGLPEPFATTLHNILYERGLFSSREVTRKPREIQGALQEALSLDVQRLTEAYFKYERQEVSP